MFDWYSLLSPHVPYLPHWFKNFDLFLSWFRVIISMNFRLLILVFSGNVWFYFVSITSSLLISLFLLFSKGCFFTSSGGLRSFEHLLNEVKPVPRVDSSGQVWCNYHFGCRDLRGNLLACQQELEVLPTGPQTTDLVNVSICSTAIVISGWALLLISLFFSSFYPNLEWLIIILMGALVYIDTSTFKTKTWF